MRASSSSRKREPRPHTYPPSGRVSGSIAAGAAISRLDALLAEDDLFRRSKEEADALRLAALRDALKHHVSRNPRYAAYCERVGFTPAALDTTQDLERVPLVPSSMFKRNPDWTRTATDEPVVETTSSGTRGAISVVPRDDTTLMRFFATASIGVREMLGWSHLNVDVLTLMPPTEEQQHLWIAYVMEGVGVLAPTVSYADKDKVDIEGLLADLCRDPIERGGKRVGLVGPPHRILAVANAAKASGIGEVPPDTIIVTIGGWKSAEGTRIARKSFDDHVAESFGLENVSQVRDAFNMVELNTVVFECEQKCKHVPPWLYVTSRDPGTLTRLEEGAVGILGYLDPTPLSYPGFVLSDDFGSIERARCCPCGITSDVLTLDRRINRLEERGCALKLDSAGK